jgi:hypothetical protein
MRETVSAMRYLDRAITDAGGIALRHGNFYGDPDDRLVDRMKPPHCHDRTRRVEVDLLAGPARTGVGELRRLFGDRRNESTAEQKAA